MSTDKLKRWASSLSLEDRLELQKFLIKLYELTS